MRFPVDTSALRFTVVGAPEPRLRHDHGPARARRMVSVDDAEPWRVQLRVTGAGAEEVVPVTVPGEPRHETGMVVRIEGLSLLTWRRPGGCGWSMRARAIAPAPASAARERP